MDLWLSNHIVCPRDKTPLKETAGRLWCAEEHSYPLVEGIPVLLLDDVAPTHAECTKSLTASAKQTGAENFKNSISVPGFVDSFVQQEIVGTCGLMYKDLINRLERYPIPHFPLPEADGLRLLDIGCSWGRWSISAARKGYRPVGLDPSLEAVLSARRVTEQTGGVSASFVVGDARHLPFAAGSFDVVFSYSVLQHFHEKSLEETLAEIAQVLTPDGKSLIQMANACGARNSYSRLKRIWKRRGLFDVRYWRPAQLKRLFEASIGSTNLSVDGSFTLNPQTSDLDLLPIYYRLIVLLSETLKKGSRRIPGLLTFADSLYVESRRSGKESLRETA